MSMPPAGTITITPMEPGDRAMVVDTWLREWWLDRSAGTLPRRIYDQAYAEAIEDLLERSQTWVLRLEGGRALGGYDEGWLCRSAADDDVVHFAYVWRPSRRQGYCRRLWEAAGLPTDQPVRCTHMTRLARKLPWPLIHDPWPARRR